MKKRAFIHSSSLFREGGRKEKRGRDRHGRGREKGVIGGKEKEKVTSNQSLSSR